VYHEAWEGRVQGLAFAAMGAAGTGTPAFRHAIERMHPAHFFAASYYERWLTSRRRSSSSAASSPGRAGCRARGEFALAGRCGCGPSRAGTGPHGSAVHPRRRVRVRNRHPLGHTRCPGYVRGHVGEIVRYDGPCNFDDVEAHSDGKRVEPLYCVRSRAASYGRRCESSTSVCVDLFEDYLEPA